MANTFSFLCILTLCLAAVQGNFFSGNDDSTDWTEKNESAKENWIDRLYKDKMINYNKNARPVQNPSHNTTVHMGLYLSSLDVDDRHQQFTINTWLVMLWTDEHLTWEPKNYMNIERIHFDQADVWTPDIAIFNSAEPASVVPFVKIPVIVDHLGRTYWFPPAHITVKCDLDISEWPSDQHECIVRMGSWSHHGEQIDIQIIKQNETGVMMSNYEANSNWDLLSAKASRQVITLEEQAESYVEIIFTFKVKRLAMSHATYITTTALVVMIVVLLTYALPIDSFYSRLVMHLFALGLLVGCYLTLFTTLPSNGGPVPFVVRYFSGTTVLTLISLVSTLFLTTHACCDSTPSSNVGKRVVGILASAPGIRSVTTPQQSYDQLEGELDLEEAARSANVTTLAKEDNSLAANQVRRVINFLLLVLFTIAFFVDYFVLRSVTK